MAVVMSQSRGCDSIYMSDVEDTRRLEDIHNRVKNCYEVLEQDDIKFTDDMVTLIKLDFIEHSNCKVRDINKIETLSPITKRYLQECDGRLDNFNPIEVKQNLQKMDLLY